MGKVFHWNGNFLFGNEEIQPKQVKQNDKEAIQKFSFSIDSADIDVIFAAGESDLNNCIV